MFIENKFIKIQLIYALFGQFSIKTNFYYCSSYCMFIFYFMLFSKTFHLMKGSEIFDKIRIWLALKQVQSILLGKYGIKTLDPR